MQEIEERIGKDIRMFDESVAEIEPRGLGADGQEVLDAAKNYRKDAEAWLSRKDLYTAFASISYAHGLLDALRKLAKGKREI